MKGPKTIDFWISVDLHNYNRGGYISNNNKFVYRITRFTTEGGFPAVNPPMRRFLGLMDFGWGFIHHHCGMLGACGQSSRNKARNVKCSMALVWWYSSWANLPIPQIQIKPNMGELSTTGPTTPTRPVSEPFPTTNGLIQGKSFQLPSIWSLRIGFPNEFDDFSMFIIQFSHWSCHFGLRQCFGTACWLEISQEQSRHARWCPRELYN